MMEIRKASVSDMFGWVIDTFKLVRNNWAKFALASLMSFLVILIPVIAFILIFSGVFSDIVAHSGSSVNWKSVSSIYAIILVIGIVFFMPFMAGWLLLCQKLDGKQAADIGTLFKPYENGTSWLKISMASALLMGINIFMLAIYIGICYRLGLEQDIKNFLLLQLNPEAAVALSASFWLAYAVYILFSQLLGFIFMLGFTEASLSTNSAVRSISKAIHGALKNFVNYFVFFIAMIIIGSLVAVVIGLLLILIIAAFTLWQNAVINGIGIASAIIVYIILALYIYPLIFSFHFFIWKSILGSAASSQAADLIDSEVSI